MFQVLKTHADADSLRRLVSPVFFRLFPPNVVAKKIAELMTGSFNRHAVTFASGLLEPHLQNLSAPLSLEPGRKRSGKRQDARRVGQLTLELYFRQLASEKKSFLDLNLDAFAEEAERVIWSPRPVVVSWEDGFRAAILQLYQGYYEDDAAGFDVGLRALGLVPEAQLLKDHFGPSSGSVSFDTAHFRSTFGKVFDSCAARGAKLHPDFIFLGVYLGTLYDHLQQVGESFEVAEAYRVGTSLDGRSTRSRLDSSTLRAM